MYRKLADFLNDWSEESKSTGKILDCLTDASLAQRVTPEGRSLGQLAWHVTLTIGEMSGHAGLPIPYPGEKAPVPEKIEPIRDEYRRSAAALVEQLRMGWTDAMLDEEIPMYGEKWKRGTVLSVLIRHEAHHRGQMTVLMRQAGLKVPGVYGPAREEWAQFNMPSPW